ncbi:ribosome biogenesis GTPase Der [candidate division WOR-3 bacterium]|nr:ribosome biogenesis GTPase Der [candidate division WOR-3 bacterium]
MLPIISIVGRENVGKSTLFNRLVGRRLAVTHREPGITRDRNIQEVDLFGLPFLLVDTGGYFPYERKGLKAKVREQVEISLESSALIFFLADTKSGITPLDLEIAERLRKLNKKIVLVVNKVDTPQKEKEAVQFYNLGFQETIFISALHRRGINDLIAKIRTATKEATQVRQLTDSLEPKFAVLGRPNVGKSTYINALLKEPRLIIDEHPGTTIDSIDVTLRYDNQVLTLVDTPGLRRRTKIKSDTEYYSSLRTYFSISRCEVAILLLDATLPITHQDKIIISRLIKEGKGIVIAVNKIDLIPPKCHAELVSASPFGLRFAQFIPITYISALKTDQIYEPIKQAIKVREVRRQKISKKRLTTVAKSWDLGVIYMVQTQTEPSTFKIRSRKDLTSNARFIENELRKAFNFKGTPIKLILR